MPATAAAAANAICAALVAGPWSQPIAAVRGYTVDLELTELDELRVDVVPVSQTPISLARGIEPVEVRIDVGFRLKPETLDNTACDAVAALADEVGRAFSSRRLDVLTQADGIVTDWSIPAICLPDHLRKYRQFTTVLQLTLRVG